MERELQLGHDLADGLQGPFGVPFRSADDDKVIGVAEQLAQRGILFCPGPVQDMQVDVRQEWADDPALRRTHFGRVLSPFFQNTSFQPLTDEFEHPPIACTPS